MLFSNYDYSQDRSEDLVTGGDDDRGRWGEDDHNEDRD